jgi:hypothetical protein
MKKFNIVAMLVGVIKGTEGEINLELEACRFSWPFGSSLGLLGL